MQKILILEDHEDTRKWLVDTVNTAFTNPEIAETDTLQQAYAWLSTNNASLALVDLNLPDGSGMDMLTHLREKSPETYLVVTTIFDDDRHLFNALKAGANGYLLKDQPRETIVENLKGIAQGTPPLSPAIARRILRHFQQVTTFDTEPVLTKREEEVLRLLTQGLSRNDIADHLEISSNTAATHIKSIYRKLDVSGRAEATLQAMKMGLINNKQDDY